MAGSLLLSLVEDSSGEGESFGGVGGRAEVLDERVVVDMMVYKVFLVSGYEV